MAEEELGAAEAQRVEKLKDRIMSLRDAEDRIRHVRQGLEAEVRELTALSVLHGSPGENA